MNKIILNIVFATFSSQASFAMMEYERIPDADRPRISSSIASKEENYLEGMINFKNKRYVDALPLLQAAADEGHGEAQYYTGLIYELGDPPKISINLENARYYYKQAVSNDYKDAKPTLERVNKKQHSFLPNFINNYLF